MTMAVTLKPKLLEIVDMLSESSIGVVYQVAVGQLSVQQAEEDFDYLSPEDIQAIREGIEQVNNGEGIMLSSPEEINQFFAGE